MTTDELVDENKRLRELLKETLASKAALQTELERAQAMRRSAEQQADFFMHEKERLADELARVRKYTKD